MPRTNRLFFLLLMLLALLGVALLWYSTPHGPGLVNDSAFYIEGAENLLRGNGYVRTSGGGELKPITHFPPLFSLLLALMGRAGMQLVPAARLANTILFGVDIFLAGWLAFHSGGSRLFGLFAALLLAVSDVFLGIYSMALSEPLFLTLMLAGYACLSHAEKRDRLGWMALSGLLLGLATLARYAGVSLFAAAFLALLLAASARTTAWRERLRSLLPQAAMLLAGALPVLLAWLGYSLALSGAGAPGNRLVTWHPPSLTILLEGFKNLLTWLAPDALLEAQPFFGRLLSLLSLLLLPGLAAWLGWLVWRGRKIGEAGFLAALLALHVLAYLGFLLVSLSLFDASTPLNDRILSVAYLAELILLAGGLGWLWSRLEGRRPAGRWALGLAALALAAASLQDGAAAAAYLRTEGQGFSNQGWRDSPTIQAVRRLPQVMLYSNKPTAIYLLTGRNAYIVPTPTDAVTEQERQNFSADLQELQQRVRQGQAVLVLFGLRDSPDPSEAVLYEVLVGDLPVLEQTSDGILLGRLP